MTASGTTPAPTPAPGGVVDRGHVPEAFDVVADSYDRMVGLNPGYHENLRRAADALLARTAGPGPRRLLDVGCGSGASTRALVDALAAAGETDPHVTALDGSAGMLASARAKRWPAGVTFDQLRAEQLLDGDQGPRGLHGILGAYLVRNLAAHDRDDVVRALHDRLEPGGVLALHEYSVRGNPVARLVWTLVCWLVIIPLSAVVARDTALYRYLYRSVVEFDSVPRLADRLRAAGFVDVAVTPAVGWARGSLHTVTARRPVAA